MTTHQMFMTFAAICLVISATNFYGAAITQDPEGCGTLCALTAVLSLATSAYLFML